MNVREIKTVSTAGRDGNPAVDDLVWRSRSTVANVGCRGLDGRSASAPTHGSPGSDIRLRLAYAVEEPAVVQVQGEGAHTGMAWKIARDEGLSVNAKGGSGGTGGRGESGQDGGRGRDGRDATKYHDAGHGDDGAPGGNGGYGSSGADGAAAGNVFVAVHDDDTDLLLPLTFDVRGGTGGTSGEHGAPGQGGQGGRGGNGAAWTERRGDSVYAYSKPGGTNGQNGPPGNQPSTYLTGGKSGASGSVQIRVIFGNGTEATYPGCYNLTVTGFDIIDENEDTINEPGEHILVHNIRVRNSGGMPSPASRSIQILIQGTPWLEPVAKAPLELPRSIQPGQEVDVPGVLRALIRNETAQRSFGVALDTRDNVQLVGFFNERLMRPLPNFCGATTIFIKYPLELKPPSYLDCVAKGDKVRFSWQLHNISSKPYGAESILRRAAATKLTDPNGFFALIHAENESRSVIDELPELGPKSYITIDQDLSVAEHAMEFSSGFLTLELLLSDPLSAGMRSVHSYQLQMQISSVYTLSPNPSYLLVVNSGTPNHVIHQAIALVRQRLHTHLDIFNLSLTGSYQSPVTNDHVLKSYYGKSVIIFGNAFRYFNQVKSDGVTLNPNFHAWELLDPWETGLLAKGGTSILFTAVDDIAALQQWAGHATFPATDFTPGADSVNDANLANVITSLRSPEPTPRSAAMTVHRFPVRKPSDVNRATGKAATELNKHLPLQRFVTMPDAVSLQANTGGVIICEGVHKSAYMMATSGPVLSAADGSGRISDYDMFFIVSCLPFSIRARMFWNILGRNDSAGVLTDVIYAGIESYNALPATKVDYAVLQALSISLQWDLTSEFYRFTSMKPRFRDPLTMPEKLSQMRFIYEFFTLAPKEACVNDTAQATLLVSTLGALHAVANSIGLWQWLKEAFACCGNRKGQLSPKITNQILDAITASCAPAVATSVRDHMLQRSLQVKAAIKASKAPGSHKNFDIVGRKELATFATVQTINAVDLTELAPASVAMTSPALQAHQNANDLHRANTFTLQKGAERVRNEIVNPTD